LQPKPKNEKMREIFFTIMLGIISLTGQARSIFGKQITWDRHSLMADDERITPVMGEIHY